MFRGTPASFNTLPSSPAVNNFCGQAAVASVLEYYGRVGAYRSPQHLIDAVCMRWPPDNFGGALGTSSNQLIRALEAHGLNAVAMSLEPWFPGGFINPANQVAWHPYRDMVERHVNRGHLAICLVKTTKVGGQSWGLHWCVFAEIVASSLRVCNAFDATGGYADRIMSTKDFHEAWEVDGFEGLIPGLRFHAVLVSP